MPFIYLSTIIFIISFDIHNNPVNGGIGGSWYPNFINGLNVAQKSYVFDPRLRVG